MPVGDAVQFKFVDMIIVHINNNCNRVRVDLFAEGQLHCAVGTPYCISTSFAVGNFVLCPQTE